MGISIHGDIVPDRLPTMVCGGTPYFCHESGFGYRCDKCLAVIGSIAQPARCKAINDSAPYETKETSDE